MSPIPLHDIGGGNFKIIANRGVGGNPATIAGDTTCCCAPFTVTYSRGGRWGERWQSSTNGYVPIFGSGSTPLSVPDCSTNDFFVSDRGAQVGTELTLSWAWFNNVQIPAGVTITSAKMNLLGQQPGACGDIASEARPLKAQIALEDADSAVEPGPSFNENEMFDRLRGIGIRPGLTTARQSWQIAQNECWLLNQPIVSPDFTAVLQEVISRPGWTLGNDLLWILLPCSTRDDFTNPPSNKHPSNCASVFPWEWSNRAWCEATLEVTWS